jgi:hypothetical protein
MYPSQSFWEVKKEIEWIQLSGPSRTNAALGEEATSSEGDR